MRFCPRSAPDYDHVNSHLSLENIENLLMNFQNMKKEFFFFSGFSEPLTKHLEELISIIRKNIKTQPEITNTDLLNHKRIKSLYKKWFNFIRCSIYDTEERLKEAGNF